MKIVDRKTFMALPAGTIFAKIPELIIVQELCVKGDTIISSKGDPIDWAYMSIANWDSANSGEWADLYWRMADNDESHPCETTYGRDGMFSEDDKFLIFEHADLLALRANVDAALELPDSANPRSERETG